MKIILTYQSGQPNRNDRYISLVPTGLCYLHACLLEAGHDSLLANFSGWPESRVERELLKIRPDIIGISQWTHNRHQSMQLADTCRRLFPDCTIIMGGGHATFCYQDLLAEGSAVDIVVLGEGEQTLLELAARLADHSDWRDIHGLAFRRDGALVTTGPQKLLADLDQLPQPARYLDRSIGIDRELQPEFIVTARGCPSACHFCSSPAFWGRKVRFRSPEAIVEEILYIRQKFGLIYFSIRDDTFTADRTRALEFCRRLIQLKAGILWNCQSRVTSVDEELLVMMKAAGCECIQLGVESGSTKILQQLGKNITPAQIMKAGTLIREVGINLSIYLISDVDGESAEDLNKTVQLVKNLQADDGYVSPLAYYPGTKLFNDAEAAGTVDSGIFRERHSNALYVNGNPGDGSRRLLQEIADSRRDDPARFRLQKERLGFCYTTNVLAGEWYRMRGEFRAAEKEFLEITLEQPENPWGWFLLGELYAERGRGRQARGCYQSVLEIVPQHPPSKAALAR
jgi:radical SAM superfamily enzyme YgiQ (UPF0313 family)